MRRPREGRVAERLKAVDAQAKRDPVGAGDRRVTVHRDRPRHPRATPARADRVPRDPVPRLGLRARARARAARRAGAEARRHRAGGGDRAARSRAAVRSHAGAARDRSPSERGADGVGRPRRREPAPHPGAVAEVAQILQGMSRTTARIWVVDRRLDVLARTGSLTRCGARAGAERRRARDRSGASIERTLLHPLYALVLAQPTEEFAEEGAGDDAREHRARSTARSPASSRPTAARRRTGARSSSPPRIRSGSATRSAARWSSRRRQTRCSSSATARSSACSRIVLATLLVGSVALTLFASRLTTRIRKLRDDAEAAIDAQGRVRGALAGSRAGDEIGDLSRSFSSVLARLAQYAGYRENMASRLSHELRTPLAVVRSSLDNLRLQPLPDDARVYIERAQGRPGAPRGDPDADDRGDAARAEPARRRARACRPRGARPGCVDGYRLAYPDAHVRLDAPAAAARRSTARRT